MKNTEKIEKINNFICENLQYFRNFGNFLIFPLFVKDHRYTHLFYECINHDRYYCLLIPTPQGVGY